MADRAFTKTDRAKLALWLARDTAPDDQEVYITRLEDALATRTAELSAATERALAWEWAYREERCRAHRAARWGARWRDLALVALGAGALVADKALARTKGETDDRRVTR